MRTLLLVLMSGSPGCSLLFDQPAEPPLNQPADGGEEDGEGCLRYTRGDFVGESGSSRYLLIDCEFDKGLSQSGALARCNMLGGALAVFETKEEHQFLLDQVSQDPDLQGTDHWIGLRYVGGQFSWNDSTTPVAFFCYDGSCGETFPSFGGDRCFAMDLRIGSWEAWECGLPGEHTDDYICEIPL